jgi:hypothetical protein
VCSGSIIHVEFCVDANDNCPSVSNRNQLDSDGDDLGDVSERWHACGGECACMCTCVWSDILKRQR